MKLYEHLVPVDDAPLDRQAATLQWLAARRKKPRVAMTGGSMRPTLRPPMILELGPAQSGVRVGDVIVFAAARNITAHRVVATSDGHYYTAGDAVPSVVERVPRARVLGKVCAVYADDGGRRADGPVFALAGWCLTRLQPLRALPGAVRRGAAIASGADPRVRARSFPALLEAVRAALAGDRATVVALLESADAARFTTLTLRHGCAGLLVEALRGAHLPPRVEEIAGNLRRAYWKSGARAARYGEHVDAVVGAFVQAGVRFVLLKGAARAYAGGAGTSLHASGDIDVLVPPQDGAKAWEALQALGYTARADEELQRSYQRTHHHLAPLYPPRSGPPVEIHIALAPPGSTSLALDYASLAPFTRTLAGAGGPAAVLGPVHAALHLLVHGRGLTPLRDAVLAAQHLRRMSAAERIELSRYVESETIDRTALLATLYVATLFAGRARLEAETRAVQRYLRWVERREDMPAVLRTRAMGWEAIERRHTGTGIGDVVKNERSRLRVAAAMGYRIAGRAVAGLAAHLYGRLLPPSEPR